MKKCMQTPIKPCCPPSTFTTVDIDNIDDTVTRPKTGDCYNTLVRYTATGHYYLFDTAGRYTLLGYRIDKELSPSSINPVQNKTLTNAIEALRRQIQEGGVTYDEFRDAVAELQASIAQEVTDRQEAVSELDGRLDDVEDTLADHESDLAGIDQDIVDLNTNISTTEDNVTNLTTKVNSMEVGTTEAVETANQAAQDVATLTTTVNGYSASIAEAQSAAEQATGAVAELTTTVEGITDDVSTAIDTATQAASTANEVKELINADVVTDITASGVDEDGSTVQLNMTKTNLSTGTAAVTTTPLPVASATEAGVINSAMFNAIQENSAKINLIENATVAVDTLSDEPTQEEITTAYEEESGSTEIPNGAMVYDVVNNLVYKYFTNDSTWHKVLAGAPNVPTWTNASLGVIKGSTQNGQIFAEANGTGSVNGWDALVAAANNAIDADALAAALAPYATSDNVNTELSGKVDKKTTTTTYDEVYTKKADGSATIMYPVTASNANYTIPVRNNGGVFSTGTPTDALHVANKEYVDDADANKLDKVTYTTQFDKVYTKAPSGSQWMATMAQDPEPSSIPYRVSGGRVKTGEPVEANDSTSKNYVDTELNCKPGLDNLGLEISTFTVYGASAQNGTPTIDNPVDVDVITSLSITDGTQSVEIPLPADGIFGTRGVTDSLSIDLATGVVTKEANWAKFNLSAVTFEYDSSRHSSTRSVFKTELTPHPYHQTSTTVRGWAVSNKFVSATQAQTWEPGHMAIDIKKNDAFNIIVGPSYTTVESISDILDGAYAYYRVETVTETTVGTLSSADLTKLKAILAGRWSITTNIPTTSTFATPQLATESELDGKLDKVTSTSNMDQAYIKGSDGTQKMVNLGSGLGTNRLLYASGQGQCNITTPTSENHIANKGYVDSHVPTFSYDSQTQTLTITTGA